MLDAALYAAVAPVLIVGAGLLILSRFERSVFPHLWVIAYLVAHVGVCGGLEFPPVDVIHWVPLFAVGGALVSRVGLGLFSLPGQYEKVLKTLLGALGTVAFAFVLLRPLAHHPLIVGAILLSGPLFVGAVALMRSCLGRFSERDQSLLRMVTLWILSGSTSVTLLLSGSALYGQLLGCTAAVMTTVGVIQFFRKRWDFAEYSFHLLFLFNLAFILLGFFYSHLQGICALLLALGLPIGLGVPPAFFAFFGKRSPLLLRVVLTGVLCGLAILLALLPLLTSDPQAGYY